MLYLVGPHNKTQYYRELSSMHRLRKRVFNDDLNWSDSRILIVNGMEFDQFDLPDAYYLIHLRKDGEVDACTRLLPTVGPYLLGDVFPELIATIQRPCAENIWEPSRFCADTKTAPREIAGILVAGMIEFGLNMGITSYVTVTELRIERIIQKYGWVPNRIGIKDHIVAEKYGVSNDLLEDVCARSKIINLSPIQNINDLKTSCASKQAA